MRGTILYGAGDVRFEDRPDPVISEPTDAVIRTVARTPSAPCSPPGQPDESLVPHLLALSDVMSTGWHSAVTAGGSGIHCRGGR